MIRNNYGSSDLSKGRRYNARGAFPNAFIRDSDDLRLPDGEPQPPCVRLRSGPVEVKVQGAPVAEGQGGDYPTLRKPSAP